MGIMEIIALVMSGLFAASEILGAIPSLKANGVVQLIINIIRRITGR